MYCSPTLRLCRSSTRLSARRCPNSRTRGRPGTRRDVVLRLLLLKHMRNWSYQVLEREVRANLGFAIEWPHLETAAFATARTRRSPAQPETYAAKTLRGSRWLLTLSAAVYPQIEISPL